MTTATAQNKAEHSTEKEKAEKRRALGRGLESLLPRPKVVERPVSGSQAAAELRSAVPTNTEVVQSAHLQVDEASRAGVPAPHGPQAPEPITITAQAEATASRSLVANLAIADIDRNPFQTRYVHDGESLDELAESIKANGVVQPIVVRPAAEQGRYVLILGERRLHASKKAGNTTIPAIVRRVSDQQAAEMTIVENLQREDLSPLEQAEAFRVLSEEFKLTQAQIGERVGLSRESVSNYMRLLRLPREVMQLLAEKKIKFAEAKELLKLDSDDKMVKAALYAVKHGYTVEQVERLVLQMNGWLDSFSGMPGQERKKSGARWTDPNVRAAQMDLERLLGVRVKIRDRKGKGKIVIEYSTVDDYERVVGMLRGKSGSE
jgi:ParB family transcriptional regulator, chromosome partitioning protein